MAISAPTICVFAVACVYGKKLPLLQSTKITFESSTLNRASFISITHCLLIVSKNP